MVPAIAQSSIKTVKKYSFVSDFNFTGEWQYLSTDFYLFNQKRFGKLINDLHPQSKKRYIRKIQEEKIEYLMITANIKDLKYFGGDLSYPIYSFQTTVDKEEGYKVNISENDEVIHLIDNLPLSPGIANIDASIEGKIITDRTKDKVIRAVADQLINLSEIPNPSGAALSVIRELGKFMKNSSSQNVYKFNSTIRLYESRDFNKQFYSLDLYVFLPSDKKSAYIDTQRLADYLALGHDPEISREQLEELIGYKSYPYFAVVNYKSKYNTEDIIGDEITVSSIQKRRQSINQKYEQGNIPNKSTYHQEMKFLEFLEKFAELKSQVNTYRLNKKNELTSDYSRTMLLLSEQYTDLLKTFQARETEFKTDANYLNSFREKYQNILDKAGLYFDMDNQLKATKDLVNVLLLLDTVSPSKLSFEEREQILGKLYGVDLPDHENENPLMQQLEARLAELEAYHFRKGFQDKIAELNRAEIDKASLVLKDELQEEIKLSNCLYCKKQVAECFQNFDVRYENAQRQDALLENKSILSKVQDVIYESLKHEHPFDLWYTNQYNDTVVPPPHIVLLKERYKELQTKRQILEEFVKLDFYELDLDTIKEYNKNLKDLCLAIEEGYDSLCEKLPEACPNHATGIDE